MQLAIRHFALITARVLIASVGMVMAFFLLLFFMSWAILVCTLPFEIADLWTGFTLWCFLVCTIAIIHVVSGQNWNTTIRCLTIPAAAVLFLVVPFGVMRGLNDFMSLQSPAWQTWWASVEIPARGIALLALQWGIDIVWKKTDAPRGRLKPAG